MFKLEKILAWHIFKSSRHQCQIVIEKDFVLPFYSFSLTPPTLEASEVSRSHMSVWNQDGRVAWLASSLLCSKLEKWRSFNFEWEIFPLYSEVITWHLLVMLFWFFEDPLTSKAEHLSAAVLQRSILPCQLTENGSPVSCCFFVVHPS